VTEENARKPFFEDTSVGKLKERIYNLSDGEIDDLLKKYEIPSPGEIERKFEIAAECGYAGLDLEETDVVRYLDQGHDKDDLSRLCDGYDGYYSIEIYNEDYWKEDPKDVALSAKEKTENLFAQIS
jgi:hypothetical protein